MHDYGTAVALLHTLLYPGAGASPGFAFSAASDDKTVLGQLVVTGVWLIAGSLMMLRALAILKGSRMIAWTSAFVLLSLVSAFWSQDASVTIRKSVFLILTTGFGVYFGRCYLIERQLRMICVAALIVTLLSVGFATLLPRYGLDHDAHEGAWVGVFTQKNVCAREMLFLLVCLLPYVPLSQSMRWCRHIAILMALVVIGGTQSRTALLLTAMVLCFFPALRKIRGFSTGLACTAFTAVSLTMLAVGALIFSSIPRLLLLVNGDMTMTGRTDIWKAVWQAIVKHPLLGYGFAAFWLSLRGESANIILALRWAVPAAHNGYLEIWLQLGAVGILLFAAGLIQGGSAALRGIRQPSFARSAWPLAVLLLALVYNLDESSLMQPNDFLWVLYIATLVNLAAPAFSGPQFEPPATLLSA